MKMIHLSDLHFGKTLHKYDLTTVQREVMGQIQEKIKEEEPDVVILAGDIYDNGSNPSVRARELFYDFMKFLCSLAVKPEILLISGNHDSAKGFSLTADLYQELGITIAPYFDGTVKPISFPHRKGMEDVCFYLFPYVNYTQVPHPEKKRWDNYDDAIGSVLDGIRCASDYDGGKRNIMVTHQYVDSIEEAQRSSQIREDSEWHLRGGTEIVNVERFVDYEYVALGHLHLCQAVKYEHIRYCGTPYPYSISECADPKFLVVVEVEDKPVDGSRAEVKVREIELVPVSARIVKLESDYYESFIQEKKYDEYTSDYVYVILADAVRKPHIGVDLKTRFPNLLGFEYLNAQEFGLTKSRELPNLRELQPLDIFKSFYEMQMSEEGEKDGDDVKVRKMKSKQEEYLMAQIQEIWGVEQ